MKKKKKQEDTPPVKKDLDPEDDPQDEDVITNAEGDDEGLEIVQMDEDEFNAAIGGVVKGILSEELKPLIEEVKTLRKKSQSRLVGALGNPTQKLTRDDDEDPVKKAIDENIRKWNERRGIIESAKPEFSIMRAMRSLLSRDESLAPFEWEVSRHVQKNLEWASGSGGGLWVPEEFLGNEFIELLRARNVTRQAGIKVLSGLTTSPVLIPRLGGGTTRYWVGQGDTLTESDVTPQQIDLTPHICIVRTTLSKLQSILQTGVEALLREDMAETLANAIDEAVLRGTGSADEPTGVANYSGVNSYSMSTGSGDTPSIDDLYDMEYMLLEDKVTGPFAWIMNPREFQTLRKIKDTNGQYLVQPDPTQASRGFLLGWPVYTTHHCRITLGGGALGELFLGKWSDVILGEWGTIRFDVTDQGSDHWERDEIGLKVVYYCDVEMRHAVSVCYCADAST